MKSIILLFSFVVVALFANEPLISKKKASLSVALPLLKSIDKDAIIVGEGLIDVYAFIDPVCPRSREFVSMIIENDKMRERYRYHFFFYELGRFHSQGMIAKIYSEKDPLSIMKKVMIEEENISALTSFSSKITKKIENISEIAMKLDINKRPYLFVVKPEKGSE